jgi:TRAP-type C4-dicarboxylate transport system permease small subunit
MRLVARLGRLAGAGAEAVAAGMLAALFLTFLLQIFTRYVIAAPLPWTLELCLTLWLWLVFWGSAFVLRDGDHVRFDMLYLAAGTRWRRIFALVTAVALAGGFAAALLPTLDYIEFYRIKRSSTLRIRLDYVFSIYGVFAVAVIARYTLRAALALRGRDPGAA